MLYTLCRGSAKGKGVHWTMTKEERYLFGKYDIIVRGLVYVEQALDSLMTAQSHAQWTHEEKKVLAAAISLLDEKSFQIRNG